jgi:hypothetical protein
MNITIYTHQKELMQHIRHTLQYTFHSPIRRREVKNIMSIRSPKAEPKVKPPLPPKPRLGTVAQENKGDPDSQSGAIRNDPYSKKKRRQRRRSFDNQIWQKINTLRTNDKVSSGISEQMRDRISSPQEGEQRPGSSSRGSKKAGDSLRRRRHSFGQETNLDGLSGKAKAKAYGNRALELDMIQKEMQVLENEHLTQFRKLLNCEAGRIYFYSQATRELVVRVGSHWYKENAFTDVAGVCADSGEVINLLDAYSDDRFNQNMDRVTETTTKTAIYMPLRANRGGGRIIGVLQMINKANGAAFDDHDITIMLDCVARVAEDIHSRFQELMTAAEALGGEATLVASGAAARKGTNYDARTEGGASNRDHNAQDYASGAKDDGTGGGVAGRRSRSNSITTNEMKEHILDTLDPTALTKAAEAAEGAAAAAMEAALMSPVPEGRPK